MIADYNVSISRRRGAKANEQVMRDRPKGSPHVRSENKSLVDVRLPFAVPIAALMFVESVVVMPVPIARLIAIVVVEPVVIVVITVVIALISLIMMIAIVVILSVSEGYA